MASDADDKTLFADLDKEAREFDKDAEIDRILKSFKLNAYEVLGLLPGVPDNDIIKTYRKKSLLIHPDKTSNPSAPDAFDHLQKAQTALLDEKQRDRLDEAIADARMLIIRERKWTVDSPELKEDQFLTRDWPEKAKHVLMENEVRRRKQMKAQLQEEGREARKEEEEIEQRKRKREHEQSWESTREQRIGSWRDFQKGAKPAANGVEGGDVKKKKKKIKVLG